MSQTSLITIELQRGGEIVPVPLIVSVTSNHRVPVLEKKWRRVPFPPFVFIPSPQHRSNGKQLVLSVVAWPEGEGRKGAMDCCVCSPMASVCRLPRNAICAPCHEGAKAVLAFLDDECRLRSDDGHGSVTPRGSSMKPNRSPKGLRDALEQLKEMRDREASTEQRAAYLQHGFALAWKDGIHTDIVVKPASGPPIPAHRAILAARSEVLRHVLPSDDRCKAPAGDSISLPDLSHADLSLFLAFLYTGALDNPTVPPPEDRQLHALLIAGDKYDVPFLRRACEARLAARVEPRNVLRTLEVAELSGSAALKERAMDTVVEHAEQVVFSPEYQGFAVRNAGLCVEITRALLANRKNSITTSEMVQYKYTVV